jgi:hypothetical protein
MLQQYYEDIFASNDWNYYEKGNYPLAGNNYPWLSSWDAENFINYCFKNGDKTKLLDEIPIDASRSIHSVSAFFLGYIIKKVLDIPDYKPNFGYLWFLACLYHDFGYYVEKNTNDYNPRLFSLKQLKKKLDIEHDILISSLNKKAGINLKTVRKYYRYCREHRLFINHSIAAGLLFYDRMMKNFYEKLEAARKKDPQADETFFTHNGLYWSSSHWVNYKIIANAILDHNIWYAYEETDEEIYNEWKLKDLIINGSPKLTSKSNPFLFLLVLVDTIEPIKAFHQINHLCVLGKIDIVADNNEKKIVISIQEDCINYEPWFAKIKDMEKWMQIDVKWNKEIYPRQVSIQIPSSHKWNL